MSSALTEFSVRLSVTGFTSSLAPSLEWICRQTDECMFATASLATTAPASPCTLSIFETYSDYSENLHALPTSMCNEILLENGSTLNYLGEGGQSCVDDEYENCPAIFYRYQDGRNRDAVCPGGTEMVLSVVGVPTAPGGNFQYILTPSPGLELLNDDGNGTPSLEGCAFAAGAYVCDSGTVSSFRFTQTSSFCDATDATTDCPFTSLGIPYGFCGGSCQQGPPPPAPQQVESFSATLMVTGSTSSLAPSLEWICRADVACTTTDPNPDTNDCLKSFFDTYLDYQEHLSDLTGSACHEIILRDASTLFGFDRCQRGTVYDDNSDGSINPCGAVIYRYQDGRNRAASCPSGTEMQLFISGIPSTSFDYIVSVSSPTEVTLISNNNDDDGIDLLPSGCDFIAERYRCSSGFVSLRFTHSARPCNGQLGSCPIPTSGYFYGACGVGPSFCSAGPMDDDVPDDATAGDEFQVQLIVTSTTSSLAPSLEWSCQLRDTACSLAPDSLSSAETGTCTVSLFDTLTDYNENLSTLSSIGGCHQVVLTDGASLYNQASCTNQNQDGNSACGAVLFRHADGRNDRAVCPSGTEMIVSAVGVPGSIDYIFRPSSLEDVELSSELPTECEQIADGYRCSSGTVTLRFTQRARPCTESFCPLRPYGIAYGACNEFDDGACYENAPAIDVAFPTTATPTTPLPTRAPTTERPTIAPSTRPTASPSFVPSPIPSVLSSSAPSYLPSLSRSDVPTAVTTIPPTEVPSPKPTTVMPAINPTAFPAMEPISSASASYILLSSSSSWIPTFLYYCSYYVLVMFII